MPQTAAMALSSSVLVVPHRLQHHGAHQNQPQAILQAPVSVLSSPRKTDSNESIFGSSQESPTFSPSVQKIPHREARRLLGSVSDGSEESLPTSEADSDSNSACRHTAPMSPLVGPFGARKYHCHPSIIPGHFRHRMLASSVFNQLCLPPGSPVLAPGSIHHSLHGQCHGGLRLPLNLYPGSLPATPTYLGYTPSPSFSPGFSPAQTASPGLRSPGKKQAFFSFDIDDIKAYHSPDTLGQALSARSSVAPCCQGAPSSGHAADTLLSPVANHVSTMLLSNLKKDNKSSTACDGVINLQKPPVTRKRSNLADSCCSQKQITAEPEMETVKKPKNGENFISASEDEKIDVETISTEDMSSSPNPSLATSELEGSRKSPAPDEHIAGKDFVAIAPPKLRFKAQKSCEDIDVSERFGSSLSLSSPSDMTESTIISTAVLGRGSPYDSMDVHGSAFKVVKKIRPGHSIRDILGSSSSSEETGGIVDDVTVEIKAENPKQSSTKLYSGKDDKAFEASDVMVGKFMQKEATGELP